jgi:V8-like Glu-specific endopeptidase
VAITLPPSDEVNAAIPDQANDDPSPIGTYVPINYLVSGCMAANTTYVATIHSDEASWLRTALGQANIYPDDSFTVVGNEPYDPPESFGYYDFAQDLPNQEQRTFHHAGDTTTISFTTGATIGIRTWRIEEAAVGLSDRLQARKESAEAVLGNPVPDWVDVINGSWVSESEPELRVMAKKPGAPAVEAVCSAEGVVKDTYVLSNAHCIMNMRNAWGMIRSAPISSDGIANYIFQENYQQARPTRKTATMVANSKQHKNGVLVTTSGPAWNLDYALFRVPGITKYFAIKPAGIAANEKMMIYHHPGGAPKKVTEIDDLLDYDKCKVDSLSGNYVLYSCDTIGGSSGSAVILRAPRKPDRKMVALHHGSDGTLNEAINIQFILADKGVAWRDAANVAQSSNLTQTVRQLLGI